MTGGGEELGELPVRIWQPKEHTRCRSAPIGQLGDQPLEPNGELAQGPNKRGRPETVKRVKRAVPDRGLISKE